MFSLCRNIYSDRSINKMARRSELTSSMPKISQCDRCLLYRSKTCSIHPNGFKGDRCLDFRPDPNAQQEDDEPWAPQGYSWYGNELIPNLKPKLTPEQQLELLDNHPFFTGVCPNCGYRYPKDNPPAVHWDCPYCGWIDDSV